MLEKLVLAAELQNVREVLERFNLKCKLKAALF